MRRGALARVNFVLSYVRTYGGVCRARTSTLYPGCSIYRRRRVKNLRRCEYSALAHGNRIFPLPRRSGFTAHFRRPASGVLISRVKERNPGVHTVVRRKGEPCGSAMARCARALPRAFDNRLVIEEMCRRRSCALGLSFRSTSESPLP